MDRAQPGVAFREMIRDEIRKQMAGVDQVSMGIVSHVDNEVEVLLDGMAVPVPVLWAAGVAPTIGLRVVCLALRGGQTWIASAEVGNVGGGSHAHSLGDLSDVELSGVTLGEVLRFGGTDWANAALALGDLPAIGLDDLDDVDAAILAAGDMLEYSGTEWVNFARVGYRFLSRQRWTSNGSFTKGSHARLAALFIRMVGGGGQGGGAGATAAGQASGGQGGGGSAYSEAFVLVADLDTTEAVTVGSGGSAGGAGANGSDGTDSVFDTISGEVRADAGMGGTAGAASTPPFAAAGFANNGGLVGSSAGDLRMGGQDGGHALALGTSTSQGSIGGNGGSSALGQGKTGVRGSGAGTVANDYGAGGSGARNGASQSAAAGGAGSNGLVMADLFAA